MERHLARGIRIYQFQVEAPGATELFINENSVLSGSGTMLGAIMLAEGNHPVRLRTVVEDAADPGVPAWLWRPPGRRPDHRAGDRALPPAGAQQRLAGDATSPTAIGPAARPSPASTRS
ncbi:MAG: hypothetical protein R2838_15040 [Caldilineaceae bacterium]